MEPSHEDFLDFLDFIAQAKERRAPETYITIKNAINVFSIPYPCAGLNKGTQLFRCRVHLENEDLFQFQSDLGPRRAVNKILSFGRANEPLQSIFYCSDNSYVARIETTKIAKDGGYSPQQETLTMGIWEVQEDLRIAIIMGNESISGKNKKVDDMKPRFIELLDKFNKENPNIHKIVLDFFSKEFTKEANGDNYNYVISCAFSNYLYENLGYDTHLQKAINLDGIMYPSVKLVEEGVNFALKPELIWSNKIILKKAVRIKMKKISDTDYKDFEITESLPINPQEETINWGQPYAIK